MENKVDTWPNEIVAEYFDDTASDTGMDTGMDVDAVPVAMHAAVKARKRDAVYNMVWGSHEQQSKGYVCNKDNVRSTRPYDKRGKLLNWILFKSRELRTSR